MLSELRTMWEIFKHSFTRADTVEYPRGNAIFGATLSWADCLNAGSRW